MRRAGYSTEDDTMNTTRQRREGDAEGRERAGLVR
jgi:hypothetical protein